jgi:hypothetical protein
MLMKARHRLTAAAIGIGLAISLAFCPPPVAAQGYYTPPGGSPFSPYLELYRPNPGLLNQYYQFMIPRVELRDTLTQHQASLNAIQNQVQSVRTQIQPQPTPVIGPTGVRGGYMNYSHFYRGSPNVGSAP